ncbi:ATP-binding protein [Micromonospora maris]|uniref:ATP-binding protein n=1 Tax=Micromonospora maris TaxID=1003110 RepID=UPI002E1084C2|nr:ATP-binding protein [Micromonospora maris]
MRNATVMPYRVVDDLPLVRAFVREQAHRLGLTADSTDALALAVNELVTNTLQHTSGGGQVRIWYDDASVYCEVVDSGPMRTVRRAMPTPDAERGRGLAIVARICDEVTAYAEPGGTIVRLRFAVRRADLPAGKPAAHDDGQR